MIHLYRELAYRQAPSCKQVFWDRSVAYFRGSATEHGLDTPGQTAMTVNAGLKKSAFVKFKYVHFREKVSKYSSALIHMGSPVDLENRAIAFIQNLIPQRSIK